MKTTSKKNFPASPMGKRQARRVAQRRKQLWARALRVIAALGALAALILLVISTTSNNQAVSSDSIEGVQSFPNLERGHTTQPVTYDQNPPAGGPHNPAWQNCGVYSQPIVNENGVHSLEHGAAWITYQPDLPAAEVQKLQTLTRQSGFRLLSPYPGLSSPIVLSAWGYQLQLEQADDARLTTFLEKYEQNPQGPESGAPCTGAVGQPE